MLKKVIMYIQSGLWVLWAALMSAAVIRVYTEGLAYQAQGHPDAWIFTREKAAAVFGAYAPVLLLAVILTIVCAAMGVRDEKADRPADDPGLIGIYKAEREENSKVKDTNGTDAAKNIRIARLALLVIAVIFIIAGIFNGSMEDMIIKAVNICTECIGLG